MADAAASIDKPTHARYWVIVSAVVLSVVTYIHRVAISQAAPSIEKELGLSRTEMGVAFSAFALSYAIFQVPGGWMADWIGPRRVLTAIVAWWSLFTMATGAAWNIASLAVARFLFGAGQGGGFPVLTKSFTTWLPPDERVRAQGIMWLAARWGGAFTPLLIVYLLRFVSWRSAFAIIGALGFVWALIYWIWYRDNPADHPGVNAAELARLEGSESTASGHGDVPWRRFFSSRTVWLLWVQYFCLSYPWYFYITWLPTYLLEARGLPAEYAAFLSGFPLFLGGIGSVGCGFALARLGRSLGGAARARRIVAGIGLAGSGAFLIVSVYVAEPFWAMVAMGMASLSGDLSMPPSWGACMDVGGKYAGSLSGSMNMAGNLAGFVAPSMVAFILRHYDNDWALTFFVSAAIYFAGAICWIFIDPVTPLDSDPVTAAV